MTPDMVPAFCHLSALIIAEPTGMKIVRSHEGGSRDHHRKARPAVPFR